MPIENPTLTAYASRRAAGSYRLTPLLSAESSADPAIARGGTFTSFAPMPMLEARTEFVITVERVS